jgi:hypothetical protein
VRAGTYRTRDAALESSRTLRVNGYPSEVVPRDGLFAVRIAGLSGEDEARALMANLRVLHETEVPVLLPPG